MASLEEIVPRLAERLGPVTGTPVPLDGGITNRNFRMRFGEDEYVIRLPGKDTDLLAISREAERIAGEAAAALGIAPPLAAVENDCLVTKYLAGRPLDARQLLADPTPVASALRRFHECGVRLPVRFWVPELLDAYAEVVRERGGTLPDDYAYAQQLVRRIGAALPMSDPVPCHDDLLPANLLAVDPGRPDAPGSVMLVDWEYAGMGHRMFDLGNLAVNNDFDPAAEERLLTAYFGRQPGPQARAALALMRIMSDAREAAWGVVQGVISELDFDFAGYAARHFARMVQATTGRAFEEWLGAAGA